MTDWAASNLAAVGATNVVVKTGVLPAGWPQSEPYDAILLEGATEIAPEQLGRQLKADGRLVCVLGPHPAWQGHGLPYGRRRRQRPPDL